MQYDGEKRDENTVVKKLRKMQKNYAKTREKWGKSLDFFIERI